MYKYNSNISYTDKATYLRESLNKKRNIQNYGNITRKCLPWSAQGAQSHVY